MENANKVSIPFELLKLNFLQFFLFLYIFRSARGYMHMRIRRDPLNRDFQLSDFERRFITIPEMIHHYTRNRLPIKGAEHMCLMQPVAYSLL